MSRFQRRRDAGQEQRATTLELFYDLVFVFAITQVSHLLLDDLTWAGAGQALLVLLVVWWAWNYTTWVTNELDPESTVVRLLLIGLMLASLVMAIAIPEAFGDRALLFAGAYVAIQVGRTHSSWSRRLSQSPRCGATFSASWRGWWPPGSCGWPAVLLTARRETRSGWRPWSWTTPRPRRASSRRAWGVHEQRIGRSLAGT